jgi:glucose-6-phosphate 1-dehydrogenase
VRDEKVKVLHAVPSFDPEEPNPSVVLGQYGRDFIGAEEVPGYLQEEGVERNSLTETYAAVRLTVNNWRWGDTPFFLRAGKRLPRRVTEVAIHFRRPPLHLFKSSDLNSNILLLRIQPDEGISLRFGSKAPGPSFDVRDVRMDFRYGSVFGRNTADAYERLLLDAMLGDSTLFARRDEVEEAWRIVDSIIDGTTRAKPLPYGAGTWGPDGARAILGPNRVWRKP